MSTRAGKQNTLGSGGFIVAPGFIALTFWFLWGPDVADVPTSEASPIPAAMISTAPRRATIGDPPEIHINGFDRTCMSCHRTFQSPEVRLAGRLQHEHIVVKHGAHRGCYGCHDETDRDRLATIDGATLPFTGASELCQQCHASVYTDWRSGMHGRSNGYWDASRGEVHRLTCTQCHDPHDPRTPAMDPIAPLPGPNTLRMGNPTRRAEHAEPDEDPLRRALQRGVTGANKAPGGSHR